MSECFGLETGKLFDCKYCRAARSCCKAYNESHKWSISIKDFKENNNIICRVLKR